jgi:hypothetical protein
VSCGQSSSEHSSPSDTLLNTLEVKSFEGFIKNEAWKSDWSFFIYKTLSNSELHSLTDINISSIDLKQMNCSNYNELSDHEKSLFLIVYFATITKLESDFNSSNRTGSNLGLLQIDTKSAIRHYRDIDLHSNIESSLFDPTINLLIGLHIFKNQISGFHTSRTKGRLLPEGNYYWEVLNLNFRNKFLKTFFKYSDNLYFCNQ